jgi:hypothetical protein
MTQKLPSSYGRFLCVMAAHESLPLLWRMCSWKGAPMQSSDEGSSYCTVIGLHFLYLRRPCGCRIRAIDKN